MRSNQHGAESAGSQHDSFTLTTAHSCHLRTLCGLIVRLRENEIA